MEAGIWTWRVEVGAALLLSSTGTGIRVKRLQQWWRWGEQSSVADTSLLATPCQRMGAGGTWSRDQTWVSCRFLGEKGRLLGKAGDKSMRMELFWWKSVDGVSEPPAPAPGEPRRKDPGVADGAPAGGEVRWEVGSTQACVP